MPPTPEDLIEWLSQQAEGAEPEVARILYDAIRALEAQTVYGEQR